MDRISMMNPSKQLRNFRFVSFFLPLERRAYPSSLSRKIHKLIWMLWGKERRRYVSICSESSSADVRDERERRSCCSSETRCQKSLCSLRVWIISFSRLVNTDSHAVSLSPSHYDSVWAALISSFPSISLIPPKSDPPLGHFFFFFAELKLLAKIGS